MFASPDELAAALDGAGYLPDPGIATAGFLALRLGKPVFLEGDAGVGKTAFASALALAAGLPLIRLQCYDGIDAAQALYEWDFPRQILHVRRCEATGEPVGDLYDRQFLIARPLLRALEEAPCVLLVDEVDRADDEFEAYLLELLSEAAITIPELGRIAAPAPFFAVLTSNRTREVHDALKRRCLYHWVDHPDPEREAAIIARHLPDVSVRLSVAVASAVARLRSLDLVKPPGVAEAIDWAAALSALGSDSPSRESLSAVLKVREDWAVAAAVLP